uniref:ribosomal protein S15 n=1 Tax=Pallavicinia lyellii TaxID=56939 RepID=UPI001D0F5BD0|nr:ribosomal protein S15 [Pallavicinia lyellii]QZZ24710.1 ribosomal protein S15 [Pallavicinia lyellii]QZZ24794.1 ribosomal protein S15 [Pallavicinia lyellii]
MPKNSFINLPFGSPKREGSIESQIFHLTNRVVRLTYHSRKHNKDYSSQRGLWKVLGKRKRLLVYLFRTNPISCKNLTNQLGIRVSKKN